MPTQVLGVGTYIQTITTESTTRLFHINKENFSRLLKLASNLGQVVSAPTVSAMIEMAHSTWVNRMDKFATSMNSLSCLDSMVKDLQSHPTLRLVTWCRRDLS